jgi:transposase-like protein
MVSTVADVLQERFYHQVVREIIALAERLFTSVLEHEQMVVLAAHRYERCRQRRGYRNGYRTRYLESRWGTLRLRVPRVRGTSRPFRSVLFRRYRRHQRQLEELIVQLVAVGVSHRRVSRLAEELLGIKLSAQAVSAIVGELEEQVAAFHRGELSPHRYRTVYLDGKHVKSSQPGRPGRRGRGRGKKVVILLAWGETHEGEEELIDYRSAPSEDQDCWEAFLTELEARGLKREPDEEKTLECVVSDGDGGLEAALLTVYPGVPHQLCVFHLLQGIARHLQERANRGAIMREAAAIYRGLESVPQARARLAWWRRRWLAKEPEAVRCFCAEFERTLVHLSQPPELWSRIRTNNPAERLIKELNRKIRQVGVFPNDESLDRMVYLVWHYLQSGGYPNSSKSLFTHYS